MRELIEEYGFSDSGVFAVALSKKLPAEILRVLAYGFTVHVCCMYQGKYIDAYGISTQEELLKRTTHEYARKNIALQKTSETSIQVNARYSMNDMLAASAAAEKLLQHLKLNQTEGI